MNEQEIAAALDLEPAAPEGPGAAAADTGVGEAGPNAPERSLEPGGNAEPAAPAPPPPAAEPELQKRIAAQQQRQALVAEQLRAIGALDPAVRSLEDLTRADNFETFYALVRKGNSLVDAFKLANFDRLTRRAGEAERQRYRNRIDTLRHLSTPTGRGGLLRPVPPDVAEQYRALNPGVSDEEIARHYNRRFK